MPKPKASATNQTNNKNNATTAKSKKRKRLEKLQQYGVDLPEIPGVPVEVIPLLVHALKTATKFFQHETLSVYNEDWERPSGNSNNDGLLYPHSQHAANTAATSIASSALDNVLNRIDSAAQDSEEAKQQKQRKTKMQDATQSWLQAVKRNTKRDQRHTNTNSDHEGPGSTGAVDNNTQQQHYQNSSNKARSVPLACFVYMWDLGQEHKRLAVRRAALYMNRLLLDKSADCRHYFLEEANHLWQWVQMLAANSSQAGLEAAKQRVWQREGHKLLLHLIEENYDDLYPKLKVSEQYLRQACLLQEPSTSSVTGQEEEEDAVTTTNMNSLRKLRDIALQHGQEEIRRVDQLIQRSYKCTDILVPRMTVGEEDSTSNTIKQSTDSTLKTTNNESLVMDADEDDDADDDDIDWEDADEGDAATEDDNDESHAKAVERTLEAMAAMGRGLQTGGLQIDFNKVAKLNDEVIIEPALASSNGQEAVAARQRLTKCARFLSERHLPRIRAWIEGLTKADRLYRPVGRNKQGGPLLLMSPQQGQERDELRDKLIHVKAQVMGVLESAASLGLCSLKE